MNSIDLFRFNIAERNQRLLPESVARENCVIAVDYDGVDYTIAMPDPSDRELNAKLEFILSRKVAGLLATPAGIEFAINRYYGTRSDR